MEKIKLKLENFEGPLDLLLHLLQKKKLSIETINISKLIDDYLDIIMEAKADSLNIKVEFLTIATELLEIKALSILSMRERERKEEELSKRLQEYKLFKVLTEKLNEMEMVFNKPYTLGEGRRIVKTASKEFNTKNLTLEEIYKAYSKFLSSGSESLKINLDKKYSITEEIIAIEGFVKRSVVNIENIFKQATTRLHLVFIFLAILELYKENRIELNENRLKFI